MLQALFSYEQTSQRIESILKIKRDQIVKLNQVSTSTVTYIPSEFAKPNLNQQIQLASLQETSILKVYYVYTQYKLSSNFNQLELDRKRLNYLNQLLPSLIEDPLVQWQIIEQTGCTDYSMGDTYFHGFVVIHREIPTEKNRAEEIEKLDAFLNGSTDIFIEPLIDPIQEQISKDEAAVMNNQANTSDSKKNHVAVYPDGEKALFNFFQSNLINGPEIGQSRVDTWVDVKFTVRADGDIEELVFLDDYPDYIKEEITNAIERMPSWRPATSNNLPINSSVNLQIRISYSGNTKGMYTRDKLKPSFNEGNLVVVEEIESSDINLMTSPQAINIKTTAVYKGLELINQKQKIALVMDVTGSMTSYIATMVKWINANPSNHPFTSFTFFNDGNNAATKNKKIGKTGGIYFTKSISEINKEIKEAMRMGNGGEAPENDIEAILYAIKNDNLANEILLIGDNYSAVRDLELLKDITNPVHVILCAAPKFIRNDYLMIAKSTGGDFILNGDLITLSELQHGEKIIIQGIEYKFTGTEFELVNKSNVIY